MPRRRSSLLTAGVILVACAATAGALTLSANRQAAHEASRASAPPTLEPSGVAPFRLGEALEPAAALALIHDRAAAQIGPGCDERDQVTVVLPVAERPLTVMAMADPHGMIEEIIAMPDSVAGQIDAAACKQRALDHARELETTLGIASPPEVRRLPVSDEYHIRFNPHATLIARWFAGGRSCDLALHFIDPSHGD